MEYIFGTDRLNGVEVENLKTAGDAHSDLEGYVEVRRVYDDSAICDRFRIVEKYRSMENEEKKFDLYEAMDYFVAIHGDSPCTAYELFMQMSDVIFSAQCDGASGLRIAQLEEIVSRALNVNWHEYDHPGDFKW